MIRVVISWIRNTFGISRTESNAYLVLIGLLLVLHFWATQAPIWSIEPERPQNLDSLTRILYPATQADTIQESDRVVLNPIDTSHYQVSTPPSKTDRTDPARYRSQSISPMDINQVDSLWLMKIYGIGPVLSKRIIKYRNLLGGFHSMDQLHEVYHLSPEVIENLKQHVFLDPDNTTVERISVNSTEFLQIASHPYISFALARAIVSYREQHGPFNNLEDLKKIHLMDESTYLRVRPYIDF